MNRHGFKWCLLGALLPMLVLFMPAQTAASRITRIGTDIPRHLHVGSHYLFTDSDTLILNGKQLTRSVDYTFSRELGAFDLSSLNPGPYDTLVIVFTRLPSWVQLSYGRVIQPVAGSNRKSLPPPVDLSRDTRTSANSSAVTISGVKTFRFTARTAAASQFSQTLDMSISGDLTKSLKITGSVSDRAYDPFYGTANSRLNELDKINLKLASPRLTAEIGDIVFRDRFTTERTNGKRISGASADYSSTNYHLAVAAARPKGRFTTFSFTGVDGLQGPYQVGQGATALPIIPGSEEIWLDGHHLTRGADQDYTMDYPTGRITFSVKHPIGSRSRIEIDYEPQLNEYKGELFSAGGGGASADSAVYLSVQWLREGDDSDRPLWGDLSSDDLTRLAEIGDDTDAASRSGVEPSENGFYHLEVDTATGDSVYHYADSGGAYAITFTFVGVGLGDYKFLGGQRYLYVGKSSGDYLPIIRIPAPERTDYFDAVIGTQSTVIGKATIEGRISSFDANLLSDIDDDDNDGTFYDAQYSKQWQWHERNNSVSARFRTREASFESRGRLVAVDERYDFFVPEGGMTRYDDRRQDYRASVSPVANVSIMPSYSRLEYYTHFLSHRMGVDAEIDPFDKLHLTGGWRKVLAELDSTGVEGDGAIDTYRGSIRYAVSPKTRFMTGFETDTRQDTYQETERGRRYDRISAEIDWTTEQLLWEMYTEDSLSSDWYESLRRHQATFVSNRTLGQVSYGMHLSRQWLKCPTDEETTLLARLTSAWRDPARRLEIRASHMLSDESRNARGITYLEVDPGTGKYILEDGQYLPDPDGNYVQIEEILSDQARVRRGERVFHLAKTWSGAVIRLNSNIEEELLPEGTRGIEWVVPFITDPTQPYLFYRRRYTGDVRLIEAGGGHIVNLSASDDLHRRHITGLDRERRDSEAAVRFREWVGRMRLQQGVELFRTDRDEYFSGIGRVEGFNLSASIQQLIEGGRVSLGGGFRRATSSNDDRSTTYTADLGIQLRVLNTGELRGSVQVYNQSLESVTFLPSYQLTDGRSGRRGATWQAALRYGLKGDVRFNFSVRGRHSDDRAARVTARGEVVAGF